VSQSSLNSFKLDNGVQVLVDRAECFQSAAIAVCLTGGSREETSSTIGCTHLLEHLLFKTTKRKTSQQIAAAIDDLGGIINAVTDVDSLCIYGQVPLQSWETLLDFFHELLTEPQLLLADVELEKSVIKQEIIEASEDPQDAVFTKFSREFWPKDSLGFPVFGYLETVAKFTPTDLQQRLRELLVGSRVVISVVGNVEQNELSDKINKTFGALPKGSSVNFTQPVTAKGIHLLTSPVSQVFMAIGLPWPTPRVESYCAGQVLAAALGVGISSRLFQKVREEHGLAYDVGAEVVAYPDTGALLLNATVERENLSRCLELMLGELAKLESDQPDHVELERAKRMIDAQLRIQEDSIIGRLWRILHNHQCYGRLIEFSEEREKYENVSHEAINNIVRDWVTKRELLVVLGGDVNAIEVNSDFSVKSSK